MASVNAEGEDAAGSLSGTVGILASDSTSVAIVWAQLRTAGWAPPRLQILGGTSYLRFLIATHR